MKRIPKVGDLIRIKELREMNQECEPYVSLNKNYKIISLNEDMIQILSNKKCSWVIYNSNWEFADGVNYHPAPKTELEWLDRVQANFKE